MNSKNKNISCSDCGESNPDHLALCEECGFYFCNTSFRKESHIVIHLKEEDCTHISTDSISQDQFKCEKCGNENIFELKFYINYLALYQVNFVFLHKMKFSFYAKAALRKKLVI